MLLYEQCNLPISLTIVHGYNVFKCHWWPNLRHANTYYILYIVDSITSFNMNQSLCVLLRISTRMFLNIYFSTKRVLFWYWSLKLKQYDKSSLVPHLKNEILYVYKMFFLYYNCLTLSESRSQVVRFKGLNMASHIRILHTYDLTRDTTSVWRVPSSRFVRAKIT